jgi:hypothetical protein
MTSVGGFTITGDPSNWCERAIVLRMISMLTVLVLLRNGPKRGSTDEVDESITSVASSCEVSPDEVGSKVVCEPVCEQGDVPGLVVMCIWPFR